MSQKRVVITGAPGTGKTVVIKELESLGYFCYHEVIRDMTAAAKKMETQQEKVSNPLVFVDDPMEFNRQLLNGRKKHFEHSGQNDVPISFFDRGIPDVLAYMDYFDQKYLAYFEDYSRDYRYDHIFILPPWKSIYKTDNERLETFGEAKELHHHLFDTYQRFGYEPIVVPKTTIEKRAAFIVETIGK